MFSRCPSLLFLRWCVEFSIGRRTEGLGHPHGSATPFTDRRPSIYHYQNLHKPNLPGVRSVRRPAHAHRESQTRTLLLSRLTHWHWHWHTPRPPGVHQRRAVDRRSRTTTATRRPHIILPRGTQYSTSLFTRRHTVRTRTYVHVAACHDTERVYVRGRACAGTWPTTSVRGRVDRPLG